MDPRHAGIALALLQSGWCVTPHFLSAAEVADLRAQAGGLREAGRFRAAAIGHKAGRQADRAIRGDEILWIEPHEAQGPGAALLNRLEALRRDLNARCTLGLFDVEIHFAHYAPGSRYARHLDRFRDDSARVLSVVLYLNEGWAPPDGGQLRLYLREDGDECVDVLPEAGTLVTFLSDRFPHEVLVARRERWSVTGWFRVRS